MAYLQSQIPPDVTTGGSSDSSGGEEPDPGALHVSLSNQSISCEDPDGALECGEKWEVSLVIPPEFQSPGLYSVGADKLGVQRTSTRPPQCTD